MAQSNYVPVRLRGADGADDPSLDPVVVRSPRTCQHFETICPRCAVTWNLDHEVLFSRTAAGRKLAEDLGVEARVWGAGELEAAIGAAPSAPTHTEVETALRVAHLVVGRLADIDAKLDALLAANSRDAK